MSKLKILMAQWAHAQAQLEDDKPSQIPTYKKFQ